MQDNISSNENVTTDLESLDLSLLLLLSMSPASFIESNHAITRSYTPFRRSLYGQRVIHGRVSCGDRYGIQLLRSTALDQTQKEPVIEQHLVERGLYLRASVRRIKTKPETTSS